MHYRVIGSICPAVNHGRCPVQYMLRPTERFPDGNFKKWGNYHSFLSGLDDKNGCIGYWFGQCAYNLFDATKCNEHLLLMGDNMHPSSELPLWELHHAAGDEGIVYLQMQQRYEQRFASSRASQSSQASDEYAKKNCGWSSHTVHSFGPFFEEEYKEVRKRDHHWFSDSMKKYSAKVVKTDGYEVWQCQLPGCGRKEMSIDHYRSKAHKKSMKNMNCMMDDGPVYAWVWNETEWWWDDRYEPLSSDEDD